MNRVQLLSALIVAPQFTYAKIIDIYMLCIISTISTRKSHHFPL